MAKYRIFRGEFPAEEAYLKKVEQLKEITFPKDYRDFLLAYNGGAILPNYPQSSDLKVEIFPIEQLFSAGDLHVQFLTRPEELDELILEDNGYELDIDLEKLVHIAVCTIGNVSLYCGEEDYGRIYYINFSGGNGLTKTGLTSFTSLMESLTFFEEPDFDLDQINDDNFPDVKEKIFQMRFGKSGELADLHFQRFKDVLAYYGHPNKVSQRTGGNVVQAFLNNVAALEYLVSIGATLPEKATRIQNLPALRYLVSQGVNVEGMLITTRNIEVVKYLVDECNQDLNESFEGEHPLLKYTNVDGSASPFIRKSQYEFIQAILNLGYDLNLSLTDDKGRTIQDRIDILEDHYQRYQKKYGR